MSDDNYDEKVLSQADIDAMLSTAPQGGTISTCIAETESEHQTAQAETVKKPASNPAPTVVEAETTSDTASRREIPKETVSSSIAESLQNTLADLVKRLGKMENAMERLDQLEKKIEQVSALAEQSPQNLQTLTNQVQEFDDQLEEISENLRSSLGYGAGKIFQCKHCDSKGLVALYVKCTGCGEETWLGWWPKKEQAVPGK